MIKIIVEVIWGLIAIGSFWGVIATINNPEVNAEDGITLFLIAAGVLTILLFLP